MIIQSRDTLFLEGGTWSGFMKEEKFKSGFKLSERIGRQAWELKVVSGRGNIVIDRAVGLIPGFCKYCLESLLKMNPVKIHLERF